MNPPPLETHHLATIGVSDYDLVFEVVLSGYLGRLPKLTRAPDHLPRQQETGAGPAGVEVWSIGV